MRNMMQLLGGVVVAGVVAAGSTAFTASGMTKTVSDPVIGGKISVNVLGAVLTNVNVDQDATDADKITAVHVTLTDGTNALSTGTVKLTMTGNTGPADTTVDCTANAGVWDCADTSPATDHWTTVSGITVSYLAP